MIPQRVQLRGFLCYKEEQEISFDGASLWLLAGLNGSGKSILLAPPARAYTNRCARSRI